MFLLGCQSFVGKNPKPIVFSETFTWLLTCKSWTLPPPIDCFKGLKKPSKQFCTRRRGKISLNSFTQFRHKQSKKWWSTHLKSVRQHQWKQGKPRLVSDGDRRIKNVSLCRKLPKEKSEEKKITMIVYRLHLQLVVLRD